MTERSYGRPRSAFGASNGPRAPARGPATPLLDDETSDPRPIPVLRTPLEFCNMDPPEFTAFQAAARAAWWRDDAVVFARRQTLGSGVGPASPNAQRFEYGVLDEEQGRLYLWLLVQTHIWRG